MPTLTVAISTMHERLEGLLDRLVSYQNNLPSTVKFLVVSQMEAEDLYYSFHGIDVYSRKNKGLSKSRNIAVDKCDTEWIWFQDDDIELILDRFKFFLNRLRNIRSNVLLVKVASRESPEEGFKDYHRYAVQSFLLAMRVSSIEIVAKVDFLRKYNLRFDENLGLGSALPSCEENLFFYDCVVRSPGNYKLCDDTVCMHTTLSGDREIDYWGRYKARGYMLGKMRSFLSPLILTWWAVRESSDGISRKKRFSLMLNTYLRALMNRYYA